MVDTIEIFQCQIEEKDHLLTDMDKELIEIIEISLWIYLAKREENSFLN